MDAKPQRPIRNLKVYDENAIPSTVAQKTIHQRNKSSPALSSMAQAGALKPLAVRRTAFGDLSNTAGTVGGLRASRDDLAIGAKSFPKLKENLPPIEEKKQTAFNKPAQRPLTAAGVHSVLTGIIKTQEALIRQPLAETQPKSTQSMKDFIAMQRKVSTKRSTVVFRDNANPTTSNQVQSAKESEQTQPPILSVAPVKRPLPQLPVTTTHISEGQKENQSLAQKPDQADEKPDLPVAVPLPAGEPGLKSHEHQEVLAEVPMPQRSTEDRVEAREAKPPAKHQGLIALTDRLCSKKFPPVDHDAPSHSSFDYQAIGSNNPPVRGCFQEPAEYWVEEEVAEGYDEDGYVTARSSKSRGDTTTGGATIILFPKQTQKSKTEVAMATQLIEGSKTAEELEDEAWDTTMVAEYGDEIFQYMRDLEIKMLPNAHYMDNQAEIQWSMRAVLIDWIVQVHHRFNLLPETLFLTINYIDRFLSAKIVSLGKLQLVGATALFIAAKYEEIDCPSIHEIAFMVDGGYTVDEILKAERFMLTMLQFEMGWPGPMSFLRRISKADDYDLETRTLAKYFLEVTIMDERFVGSPPSFVAAGAHCLARLMLRKGQWSPAHVYYSGYTYSQLYDLVLLMVECCERPRSHHAAVYNKYVDKRYKRASMFAANEMIRGFQVPPVGNNLPMGTQALLTYDQENPFLPHDFGCKPSLAFPFAAS